MQGDQALSWRLRLKNCLQTILDLEPALEKLDMGHFLLKEYEMLKSFIERLGEVDLAEEDVSRIERATENFLDELRAPLSMLQKPSPQRRLLH